MSHHATNKKKHAAYNITHLHRYNVRQSRCHCRRLFATSAEHEQIDGIRMASDTNSSKSNTVMYFILKMKVLVRASERLNQGGYDNTNKIAGLRAKPT